MNLQRTNRDCNGLLSLIHSGTTSDKTGHEKGDPSHFVDLSEMELIAKVRPLKFNKGKYTDVNETTVMDKAKDAYSGGAQAETDRMKNKGSAPASNSVTTSGDTTINEYDDKTVKSWNEPKKGYRSEKTISKKNNP